jgi:ABC-2 type transport system ATP-binding protein
VDALTPLVSGPLQVDDAGRVLRAPVRTHDGLATAVVRALDAAGVSVDDVEVHHPSLDDVFFALTAAPTPVMSGNGAHS